MRVEVGACSDGGESTNLDASVDVGGGREGSVSSIAVSASGPDSGCGRGDCSRSTGCGEGTVKQGYEISSSSGSIGIEASHVGIGDEKSEYGGLLGGRHMKSSSTLRLV